MKKFLLALCGFLFLSSSAFGQGINYYRKEVNDNGTAIAYPLVTVCTSSASLLILPCTPKATIYTDSTLGTPLANPFRGDAFGNIKFGAAAGTYVVFIGPPYSPGYSFKVELSAGGSGTTNDDNLWTAAQRFCGPVPYRDATCFGAVSSTATSSVTTTAGSPNVTITGWYSGPSNTIGDWQNSQYMSIYGAGATATVPTPAVATINISSISRTGGVVTAVLPAAVNMEVDSYVLVAGVTPSSFNGLYALTSTDFATTVTWPQALADDTGSGGTIAAGMALYEGTIAGTSNDLFVVDTHVSNYGVGFSGPLGMTFTAPSSSVPTLKNLCLFKFPGSTGSRNVYLSTVSGSTATTVRTASVNLTAGTDSTYVCASITNYTLIASQQYSLMGVYSVGDFWYYDSTIATFAAFGAMGTGVSSTTDPPTALTFGAATNYGPVSFQTTVGVTPVYNYNAVSVGHGGGVSAKSATLTVSNGPNVITDMAAIWMTFGMDYPGAYGVDFLCIYRNNSFIGRTYDHGYKDDGTVWARNSNCPAALPSSATADTLVGRKILSGAGTSNLILDGNAATSTTTAYAFHDSEPAIKAALDAAIADNTATAGGGPDVILPSGSYAVSRLDLENYKLNLTGALNLTTHPLIVSGTSVLEGHGNQAILAVNYNIDQARIVTTDHLGGSIDAILFPGGQGGNTVRNISTASSLTHDVVMSNTIAGSGSNGITIENFAGSHFTAGDCLWSNGDAIFVKLINWRCQAATFEQGAPINRYSIYLSNVSAHVIDVVWDMKDIFMSFGAIWADGPAPRANSSFPGISFWRMSGVSTESIRSKGFWTIDAGCTTSPYDIRTLVVGGISEFGVGSDAAAPKGQFYFPRAGKPGCDRAYGGDLAGGNNFIGTRGGDPTIGADIPFVANSLSVSLMDGGTLHSDEDLNLGESRLGPNRFVSGGVTYMRCPQGVSAPCAAVQMLPPDFTIDDGGAGGSCAAGVTYYFQVSASDGVGWTKIGMQTLELSASTGAGGEKIRINFFPGYAAKKYRVWYGTTSYGTAPFTTYYETLDAFPSSYNFICAADTHGSSGSGTAPHTSTAYWAKFASQTDDISWIGSSIHDHIGLAVDPDTIGTTYNVYLGGLTNIQTSLSLNAKLVASATNPTIASGFGSSPSVVTPNGTVAFTVNVGTGGTATAGVITMPTAPTGWACGVNDITAAAGHVAYNTRQTASSVTSVTVENQTLSTGAAVAWAASDILRLECSPY